MIFRSLKRQRLWLPKQMGTLLRLGHISIRIGHLENMPVTISSLNVWKRSEPRPAQSPTLSPTKSATTAGFRASSSGIPISILPTKSAPMSADFVKMPPPICANNAARLAPNPKPTSTWMSLKARRRRYNPSKAIPVTRRSGYCSA